MPFSIGKLLSKLNPINWGKPQSAKPTTPLLSANTPPAATPVHTVPAPNVQQVAPTTITLMHQRLNVDSLVADFRASRATNIETANEILANKSNGSNFSRHGDLYIHDGKREILVLGDLHGNVERLNLFLEENGDRLERGEIEIVFLGDILHQENKTNLTETTKSRKLQDAVMMLTILYPEQVHQIEGNHDYICADMSVVRFVVDFIRSHLDANNNYTSSYQLMISDLISQGVFNGLINQRILMGKTQNGVMVPQAIAYLHDLCLELLQEKRLPDSVVEMVMQYHAFFEHCPLSIIVDGDKGLTYMAHSAIIKNGVRPEQLIHARQDPALFFGLLMNRPSDAHVDAADCQKTIEQIADSMRRDQSEVSALMGHDPNGGSFGYMREPFPGRKCYVIHSNVDGSFGWAKIEEGAVSFVPYDQARLGQAGALATA